MKATFKHHALRVGVAAATFVCVLAPSAAPASAEAERWMMLNFMQFTYASEPLTRADVDRYLMRDFAVADLNGNGVSKADYESADDLRIKHLHAFNVSMLMRDDLNGDRKISRAEVEQAYGVEPGATTSKYDPTLPVTVQAKKNLAMRAMQADANKDGTITWPEVQAQAAEDLKRYEGGHDRQQPIPLILDINGDGTVSRTEYQVQIDRVFDAIDTNHDGSLVRQELGALRGNYAALKQAQQEVQEANLRAIAIERATERRTQQLRTDAAKCGLPSIPKAAKLIVVSAYEGQALSSVALGGDDKVVTATRIIIEPGPEPLALVLTSFAANIWQIEGDIGRVTSVIAQSHIRDRAGSARAGVTGVSRNKVRFAKTGSCLLYERQTIDRPRGRIAIALSRNGNIVATALPPAATSPDAIGIPTRFALELGHDPDYVFPLSKLSTIALPSGSIDNDTQFPNAVSAPTSKDARDVWNVMLRHNPKGVADLDPTRVVAATTAHRFSVLPKEAGLAWYVQTGALEVSGTRRQARVGNITIELTTDTVTDEAGNEVKPETVPSKYTIRRQITIPAGLVRGHEATFVLPQGIPEPDGNLEPSTIERVAQ